MWFQNRRAKRRKEEKTMGRKTSVYMHHEQNNLPEFPIPLSIPHNLAAAATAAHPTEFWPQNLSLHSTFNPSLLHQNLSPAYKMLNFHASLLQYMRLNSLGTFGYPQRLGFAPHINPTMIYFNANLKESPKLHDIKK